MALTSTQVAQVALPTEAGDLYAYHQSAAISPGAADRAKPEATAGLIDLDDSHLDERFQQHSDVARLMGSNGPVEYGMMHQSTGRCTAQGCDGARAPSCHTM